MTTSFLAIVRSYKFFSGPCCLVTADGRGLSWMEDKFIQVLEGTSNDEFVLGDGMPFESDGLLLRVLVSTDPEENRVALSRANLLEWWLGRAEMVRAVGKIKGMTEADGPCHNYFDIESGFLEELIISSGEYTKEVVREMSAHGAR